MEDKHLLEVWKKYVAVGDMASLKIVYDVLYKDTLNFAISKCKNSHLESEDIADRVWEKLAVKKPLIERNIRAYIFRMAKHTFLDLLKKDRKIVSNKIPEDVIPEPIISMFLQEDESKHRDLEIRQCLDKKEYKFIMQLADLLCNEHKKQQAYKQLSQIFGIALKTIGDKRRAIMKKLEACRKMKRK